MVLDGGSGVVHAFKRRSRESACTADASTRPVVGSTAGAKLS
jgi:hypothetical protein